MAGVQARIGDCWEITGLIQRARGEISGATESLEKAVELRMRLALIDDDERPICLYRLARTLREYERMLMDGGRNGDAAEVRDQIREVCEIIHLPLSLFDP